MRCSEPDPIAVDLSFTAGELRRRIGARALEVEANAILGYSIYSTFF